MTYIPHTFGGLLASALHLLSLLIFVHVIVSWLINFRKLSPYNGFVRGLNKIVNPILDPVRRALPPSKMGGMDLSPLIAIVVITSSSAS